MQAAASVNATEAALQESLGWVSDVTIPSPLAVLCVESPLSTADTEHVFF